jgi:hypothetical protein
VLDTISRARAFSFEEVSFVLLQVYKISIRIHSSVCASVQECVRKRHCERRQYTSVVCERRQYTSVVSFFFALACSSCQMSRCVCIRYVYVYEMCVYKSEDSLVLFEVSLYTCLQDTRCKCKGIPIHMCTRYQGMHQYNIL